MRASQPSEPHMSKSVRGAYCVFSGWRVAQCQHGRERSPSSERSETRERLLSLLIAAILVLIVPVVDAALIRVSAKGVDANICGTLASPCASFRFALLNIAQSSDTIELVASEYVDSGPTIEFGSASGLSDITSLSQQQRRQRQAMPKDYSRAFMQFVDADVDIEFANCVFEASRNPNKGYGSRGGVRTISTGSPKFTNCMFAANWAGVASAFHISGTASPVFDFCTFENSGCYAGGWSGVVLPEDQSTGMWKNSVFRNNSCDYGDAVDDGGTATPLFVNCSFESNFDGTLGGAYYGFGNTQTKFSGCRFYGNRVGKGGVGQDYYLSSSVSTTFENTLFDTGPNPVLISDGASETAKDNSTLLMIGCTATGYRAALGVVIFSIDARGSIESSTFSNNECVRGGAIMASNKPVFIRNCTFLNNVASEGGAVYIAASAASSNSIIDSHFGGNEAKSTGGAIRISGPATVTMSGCVFKANSAQGIGGGAIYLASGTTLLMGNSTFEGNYASSGGAIWSEGKLNAMSSVFRSNYLLTNDESAGDACGVDASAEGAIYSTLAAMLSLDGASTTTEGNLTTAAAEYKIDQLQLDTLTLEYNNASMGGRGGIFLDQQVPQCMKTKESVCKTCIFIGNDAAYGEDVATIVNTLELRSKSLLSKWALVSGNDVSIGASDLLGQALQGSHPPLLVRLKLLQRDENGVANASSSPSTVISLTTNISRTIRNGEAIFKALALRMASGETNKVDHSLTLSFASDTGAVHTAGNGLLNAGGSCLVEASGGTDRVIAGIIFSVVVGGSFMFIHYWSYKNSNRVMKTIQQLVTGVGSIMLKFFFELLDMASDLQALINLFVFDVSLSHLTFVRVAYVTCYALSVIPSVLLVHATVQNIVAQWKRTKTRKIFARRNRIGSTENSNASMREDTTETEGSTTIDESGGNEMKMGSKVAFGAKKSSNKTMLDLAADPVTLSKHSARKLIGAYIKHEIEVCEQELEYYRTRATLMKRVLARLVAGDLLLLLVMNINIYLPNHSILQSRVRSGA